jgi:hypothetical protein
LKWALFPASLEWSSPVKFPFYHTPAPDKNYILHLAYQTFFIKIPGFYSGLRFISSSKSFFSAASIATSFVCRAFKGLIFACSGISELSVLSGTSL